MYQEIEQAIEEIAKDFKTELDNNLPAASHNLINQSRTEAVGTAGQYSIQLIAPDYLEYVENGRSPGKMPPPNKIEQWCQSKGLVPANGKSLKQTAFAIATHIKQNGIKPQHPVQRTIDSLSDHITNKLSEAADADLNTL